MRTRTYALTAAALLMTALAACSKPAETPAAVAADATAVAADTTAVTADTAAAVAAPGGAVSPLPANGNEAINADANTADASKSPGSNSFTEMQARGQIENAGYTNVTGLTKTTDGMWTGKAMKSGKSVNVAVDFKGAVSTR